MVLPNGTASLEYSLAVLYKVSHMHTYFILLLSGIIYEKRMGTAHSHIPIYFNVALFIHTAMQ